MGNLALFRGRARLTAAVRPLIRRGRVPGWFAWILLTWLGESVGSYYCAVAFDGQAARHDSDALLFGTIFFPWMDGQVEPLLPTFLVLALILTAGCILLRRVSLRLNVSVPRSIAGAGFLSAAGFLFLLVPSAALADYLLPRSGSFDSFFRLALVAPQGGLVLAPIGANLGSDLPIRWRAVFRGQLFAWAAELAAVGVVAILGMNYYFFFLPIVVAIACVFGIVGAFVGLLAPRVPTARAARR